MLFCELVEPLDGCSYIAFGRGAFLYSAANIADACRSGCNHVFPGFIRGAYGFFRFDAEGSMHDVLYAFCKSFREKI